jgi:hypothetical protein
MAGHDCQVQFRAAWAFVRGESPSHGCSVGGRRSQSDQFSGLGTTPAGCAIVCVLHLWDGVYQGTAVGMEGGFEELRSPCHSTINPAYMMPIQIGDLGMDGHIVGDVKDGQSQVIADVCQLLKDHPLHVDIQGSGRLIGDEQVED